MGTFYWVGSGLGYKIAHQFHLWPKLMKFKICNAFHIIMLVSSGWWSKYLRQLILGFKKKTFLMVLSRIYRRILDGRKRGIWRRTGEGPKVEKSCSRRA